MSKIPYTLPKYHETSFNCPFCNAFSEQNWRYLRTIISTTASLNTEICRCSHCGYYSIWHEEKLIYPLINITEPPNEDLSDEVKRDYLEAAEIVQRSPRGAAALLRLSIQKLCMQLGERGRELNTDIGNLVKKGLDIKIQKALDAVRVIGNEAVHPGELDLKDELETASKLFILVNFIANEMITKPREIEKLFKNKVSDNKKKQIAQRDSK